MSEVEGKADVPRVVSSTPQPVKEIREIVRLKARGWIDPGKLKTHNMTWDEIPEAYLAYADHADNLIKIAVSAPD